MFSDTVKRKSGEDDSVKVIFSDVDGVLNHKGSPERTPNGYTGVSDELIGNLAAIAAATGAEIILSSDWRLIREHPVKWMEYQYLTERLEAAGGLEIAGYTDDIEWSRRGEEIRKYLDDHPEVTDYVVLDDLPFSDFAEYGLLPHLILTDRNLGLTSEDVEAAIRILNG